MSSEPFLVPVKPTLNGQTYDPTHDVVNFAFMGDPISQPQSGDWHAGAWQQGGPPYLASIVVGAGGQVLAKGYYYAWIQVLDSASTPAYPVGTLKVY